MKWISKYLRKYADFNGRASRKEYWIPMSIISAAYFAILIILVLLFIASVSTSTNVALFNISTGLMTIVGLAMFGLVIPTISVTTRRLHDTGKSGWWQLINFIPLIGVLILLIFLCLKGDEGINEYGPPDNNADS